MSTAILPKFDQLIDYGVTQEAIAIKRAEFESINFTDTKGYEAGRKAIAECRATRSKIEERRKEYKKDALEYGRMVDAKAKTAVELIESIESPLQHKKDAVDAERERIKQERIVAERAKAEAEAREKLAAEEARMKAEREAEAKRLEQERAAFAAEQARLAEEREKAEEALRIERERIAAEQQIERQRLAAIEAAQRAERERVEQERKEFEAKLAAERAAIEAERLRVQAEREAQERAEFQRQAKIKAEADAKEKAEREAREAEERRIAELERKAAEARRLEALKPDVIKVQEFSDYIKSGNIKLPQCETEAAKQLLSEINDLLMGISRRIDTWIQNSASPSTQTWCGNV